MTSPVGRLAAMADQLARWTSMPAVEAIDDMPVELNRHGSSGGRRADRPISVWAPGCATGEEAYSLARLFVETVEPMIRCSS
jgi:hypothetical protein